MSLEWTGVVGDAHGTGKRRKGRIKKGMGASQGGVWLEGTEETARRGVEKRWYYGAELTSILTESTRFFCFVGSWDDDFSGPFSVIFLTAFPIADPILGISFSIF